METQERPANQISQVMHKPINVHEMTMNNEPFGLDTSSCHDADTFEEGNWGIEPRGTAGQPCHQASQKCYGEH